MGQMDRTQVVKTWVKWIEHRLFKHVSNGLNTGYLNMGQMD